MGNARLGRQIRAARCLLTWSRVDLADAAGCSAVWIGLIENAKREPSKKTLAKIFDALEDAGIELIDERRRFGAAIQVEE